MVSPLASVSSAQAAVPSAESLSMSGSGAAPEDSTGLSGMVAPASGLDVPKAAVATGGTPRDRGKAMVSEQSRSVPTAQSLGLGSGENLVVKDVITDADGSTHVRYNRTFNGLRVVGGDLISHRDKSGQIKNVTWNASPNVAVASTTPKLSLASAQTTGAHKASLVQDTTSATKGELIVVVTGESPKATQKLAYDVQTEGVRADQTPSRLHTIVDANTGATLEAFDEIHNGTGNGLYAGQVPIATTAGPYWSMHDAVGNYTTDVAGGVDDIFGDVPGWMLTDADDVWGNGTVNHRATAGGLRPLRRR